MNMLEQLRNARAVRQVRAGDRAAFRELVERYARSVQWVAYAHLGNHEEAEDVCQDTFLKAFESLDSLRQASKIGSWLLTLARNRARDILRRRATEAAHRERLETEPAVQPQHEREDTLARVRIHLAALNEDDREVLVLHYFEGRHSREIAALLGITPAAARKRMQRAREALGERLVDEFGVAAKEERKPKTERIMALVFAAPAPKWMKLKPVVPLAASVATKTAAVATVGVALITAALFTPIGQTLRTRLSGHVVSTTEQTSPPTGKTLAQPKAVAPTTEVSAPPTLSTTAPSESSPASSAGSISGSSISGRVYFQETGAGIPNRRISAMIRKPMNGRLTYSTVASAATDSDGRYRLEGLEPGNYTVDLDSDDMWLSVRSDRSRKVQVEPNVHMGNTDYPLTKGYALSGRVVDAQGNPRPDARVFLSFRAGDNSYGLDSMPVSLESEANFRIEGTRAGDEVELWAEAKDDLFGETPSITTTNSDTNDLVITLSTGNSWTLSGTLIAPDGSPVHGVKIGLHTYSKFSSGRKAGFSAVSGPNGHFEGKGQGAGPHIFYIQSQQSTSEIMSWSRAPSTEVFGPRDPITINAGDYLAGLQLQVAAGTLSISGRVLNEAGEPQHDVAVTSRDARTLTPSGMAMTNEQGVYSIGGLAEGGYVVIVTRKGREASKVAEAGSSNVDFTVEGANAVTGRVVDAETNQPVTDFEVSVSAWDEYSSEARPMTRVQNSEGRFTLSDLRSGASYVVVRAAGYAWTSQPLESLPKEEIIVRLEQARRISGMVVSEDNTPVEGARIFDGVPRVHPISNSAARAKSDAQGRFELPDVASGALVLYAMAEGYAPETASTTTDSSPVTIVLSRGGTIAGRISNNGQAIAGAYVRASSAGDARQPDDLAFAVEVRTSADGTYALRDLSPGLYILKVTAQHESTSWQMERRVEVGPGETANGDVAFTPNDAALEVRVDPPPATPMTIALTHTESGESRERAPDAQGVCRFEEFPAGPCTWRARWTAASAEQLTLPRAVTLLAGQTIYETITLSGEAAIEGTLTCASATPGRERVVFVFHGAIAGLTAQDLLRHRDHAALIATAPVSSDGGFRFENLNAGTYTLAGAVFPHRGIVQRGTEQTRYTAQVITLAEGQTAQVALGIP